MVHLLHRLYGVDAPVSIRVVETVLAYVLGSQQRLVP